MFTSSEERYQDRVRRRTLRQLGDPEKAEQARRASLIVSERVFKSCCGPQIEPYLTLPKLHDDAMSVASFVSSTGSNNNDYLPPREAASERAVRRGRRRGESEPLEHHQQDFDLDSEFDVTTITEAITTESSSKPKAANKKSKKKKWKLMADYEEDHVDQEAFMCGICGEVFSNIHAAERHEDFELHQLIMNLGWVGENNPNLAFLQSPAHVAEDVLRRSTFGLSKFESARGGGWFGVGSRSRSGSADSASFFRSKVAALPPSEHGDHSRHTGRPERMQSATQFFTFDEKFDEKNEDDRKPAALSPIAEFESFVPPARGRSQSEVRFQEKVFNSSFAFKEHALLMTDDYVVLADEALVNVCERAEPIILTETEKKAERELALLAADKAYYDELSERALLRKQNPTNKYRSESEHVMGKVQNKLLDAYQLMKQGDHTRGMTDEYTKKKRANGESTHTMTHTDRTMYLNVMVKNSVEVVKNEIARLARQKWEGEQELGQHFSRFERFRVFAHANLVKLAGLALASDFTPRRIAIQLSNDLYRLLTPRLKRKGVVVDTEIEYRVGGYFVLAVNILSVDWTRFLKTNRRDLLARRAKWRNKEHKVDEGEDAVPEKLRPLRRWWIQITKILCLTKFDILAQLLAWLYFCHWLVYTPILAVAFRSRLGQTMRAFILSGVTDEVFSYVEEKGMEMEILVCKASKQAAFMLTALRQIRAEGIELKKKQKETETSAGGVILGPLLGPAIKADKSAAVQPPGFEVPQNLEFVGLELDLPVGFRRLRWALLSSESTFVKEAIWKEAAKYENITMGEWSKHGEHIGKADLPPDVKAEDFIGAVQESSYLMPKSAFVSANTAYETSEIIAYNDYCFCVKRKTLTPEVPFGNTFIAWTQVLVINTGNDSCRFVCSVEAEFPNGPPMVARSIQSGMRAGTGEAFVLMGETIARYADTYP